MNRLPHGQPPRTQDQQPWGRACGFLAACWSTLIGVWCELEPDVILVRALAIGVGVGLAARVAVTLLHNLARWQRR